MPLAILYCNLGKKIQQQEAELDAFFPASNISHWSDPLLSHDSSIPIKKTSLQPVTVIIHCEEFETWHLWGEIQCGPCLTTVLDLEPGVSVWEPHTSPFLYWKSSGFRRKRQCIFLCARGEKKISPPDMLSNENNLRNHECWHRRASSSTLSWSRNIWNFFLFTDCYNILTLTWVSCGVRRSLRERKGNYLDLAKRKVFSF